MPDGKGDRPYAIPTRLNWRDEGAEDRHAKQVRLVSDQRAMDCHLSGGEVRAPCSVGRTDQRLVGANCE